MIKEVSIQNFKGTTRVISLGQLNIFRGWSGSGKSTWLEAIRVAVLGHDPGYGKLIAETMAFSSEENMSVMVTTEDVSVQRSFISKGDKTTQKISINGMSMSLKASEPELAKHFGHFPMMLNPAEFFEMSDDKKITFLFGLSDTQSSSLDLQRKVILSALEGYTEAVQYLLQYEFNGKDPMEMEAEVFVKLVSLAIDNIAAKDVPIGRALTKIFSEYLVKTMPNGQATLSMYASTIRSEINAYRRAKSDAEAANRKLISEKAEKMDLMEYNDEENQHIIEKHREEISELEKEIHGREKLKDAKERLSSGIGVHEAALKQSSERLKELMDSILPEVETKALDKWIADLVKSTEELGKSKTAGEGVLRELQGVLKTLKSKPAKIHHPRNCKECGEQLICPNCQTKKSTDTQGMEDKMLADEIEKSQEAVDDAERYLAQLEDAIGSPAEKLEEMQGNKIQQEKMIEERGRVSLHHVDLERLLVEEKKNLDNVEEPGADIGTLREQLGGLKKILGTRLIADKNHQWLRTLEGTISKSNETIYNSEAMVSALTYVEKAVKNVRDDLTNSATEPIEVACNALLGKVKEGLFLTYEIEDGKFDIRCMNLAGNVVSFKTLSGGEKVLYLSAQLLALMTIVDPKLKILEVEMGELSGNLVPAFMEALEHMTGDSDIQVILSSCHGDFEVGDPTIWTVHEMGGK